MSKSVKTDIRQYLTEVLREAAHLEPEAEMRYLEENLPSGCRPLAPSDSSYDCEMHAIGTNAILSDVVLLLPETDKPEPGDVVIYRRKGIPKHAARYIGDGKVAQKCGNLALIETPVELRTAGEGDSYTFHKITDYDRAYLKKAFGQSDIHAAVLSLW